MININVFPKILMVGVASASLAVPMAAADGVYRAAPAPASLIKVADSAEDKMVTGAENFVGSMAQRAIGFLGDDELSAEQQSKKFEKLLNDSFDMKTLARFSLGRYWRVSTKQQRNEYLELFRKMIVEVYSTRFGEYGGQNIDVRSGRIDGTSDTIVTSYMVSEGAPEVQIDWRVRYKDGRYKVIDVIVEGVSMAVTQRSDFSSVIQRGGGEVEVLLAHLKH